MSEVSAHDQPVQPAPPPETPPQAPKTPEPNALSEWIVMAIMVLFAITSLVQSFVIPTVSMEDTLLRGDHVLVDKLSYAPSGPVGRALLPYTPLQRGDIIVFRWPIDISQNYVKRVVATPGDRLKIVNKQVYLNGQPVAEPYKFHKTAYIDSYRDNFPSQPNVRLAEPAYTMLDKNVVNGEVVVPPGHYFAMGDNRDNSLDSRYWGFVPRANIIGKPLMIFWSYDAPTEQLANRNIIDIPHWIDLGKNFFRKTRWSRTFRFVRVR